MMIATGVRYLHQGVGDGTRCLLAGAAQLAQLPLQRAHPRAHLAQLLLQLGPPALRRRISCKWRNNSKGRAGVTVVGEVGGGGKDGGCGGRDGCGGAKKCGSVAVVDL